MEPAWTREDLAGWHRAHVPALAWLGRPARHQFRWRLLDGTWRTAERRMGRPDALARRLASDGARDAYVGTASWLDPVRLPRLSEAGPAPVLLDHLVVFDIDERPFSLARLDVALRATARLVRWMQAETALQLVHIAFSGAKGFHVVARDPDRAPFAVAAPRDREAAVRAARAALLESARAAGHPVDPLVTADIRRVIRIPGTLHGATGWACTIVDVADLDLPIETLLSTLPRHPLARTPPARAKEPPVGGRSLGRRLLSLFERPPALPAAPRGALELQASTHVPGTRDREALLAWLPAAWGHDARGATRARRLLARLEMGPGLLWESGGRLLVLAPRAAPLRALACRAGPAGLPHLARRLDRAGHSWVAVAPRRWDDGETEPDLVARGVVEAEPSKYPWSRAHLALARRLGQPFDLPSGARAIGGAEPALRLVEIR